MKKLLTLSLFLLSTTAFSYNIDLLPEEEKQAKFTPVNNGNGGSPQGTTTITPPGR